MKNEMLTEKYGEPTTDVSLYEVRKNRRQPLYPGNGSYRYEEKNHDDRSPISDHHEHVLPLDRPMNRLVKRSFDIVCSLLVTLLVFPWLVPLMALCIRLDSKGPVFFLQKRNGRNGKIFTCIKLRTMAVNAASDLLPAAINDSRITRFGRFLRNYHLDELPQFLNVLWGDMSVIGPRPHMVSENLQYEKSIPHYTFRYRIKPGITGLGQVNNHVMVTNLQKMRNRTYWDMLYIRNWSLRMDAKILFRTLGCVRHANPKIIQHAAGVSIHNTCSNER